MQFRVTRQHSQVILTDYADLGEMKEAPFIHEKALVETDAIGEGTRIWAFAHVLKNVRIGSHCNIGDHAFIESGVTIGNNVTIKTVSASGSTYT